MKKLIVAATVLTIGLASMNANAWGDREQGILIGIGSAILFDKWRDHNRHGSYGGYGGGSYYDRFPPFRCSSRDRVECAYQKGEYDRDRQQWEEDRRRALIEQREAEQRAYECGRTGNCQ